MKKLSILLLLPALIFACGGGEEQPILTMYANAKSGLLVRADSNTNASKLGLIPYGEQVDVFEQSEHTQTIDGKAAHWMRVEYKGQAGWVYGGYLSPNPPPKLQTVNKCEEVDACYAKCEGDYPNPDSAEYQTCHEGCREVLDPNDECW